MTIEYLRYSIPEGMEEKFEADVKDALKILRQSQFCKGCELSRCEEKPNLYILRIHWTSIKDHVEGFRASAQFREFLPLVRAYFKHLEEMRHYTSLEI